MLAFSRALAGRLGTHPITAATLVVLAFAGTAAPASAQVRLDAQYTLTLAGLPIGKGSWVIDISDSHYASTVTGGTTGLLRVFTGGHGTTAVQGTLQGGRPLQSTYTATIVSRKKADDTRLAVSNGNVTDLKLDPPRETEPDRVPITEESQVGILDPMTATLLRVPGTGNPLSAEACHRKLAIFDGRMRYDLQLAFKRLDKVKAAKGYEGPAVVCAIYFSPVAGHIPSRSTIKYIERQRDMEVWLAPIAGTRVLVPFRVAGPTPIGEAVVVATQFVATTAPTVKAAASGAKAQ